jgi:hypothetical protein
MGGTSSVFLYEQVSSKEIIISRDIAK